MRPWRRGDRRYDFDGRDRDRDRDRNRRYRDFDDARTAERRGPRDKSYRRRPTTPAYGRRGDNETPYSLYSGRKGDWRGYDDQRSSYRRRGTRDRDLDYDPDYGYRDRRDYNKPRNRDRDRDRDLYYDKNRDFRDYDDDRGGRNSRYDNRRSLDGGRMDYDRLDRRDRIRRKRTLDDFDRERRRDSESWNDNRPPRRSSTTRDLDVGDNTRESIFDRDSRQRRREEDPLPLDLDRRRSGRDRESMRDLRDGRRGDKSKFLDL